MYEKKIKYVDFKGTEREETFYFNLSQSELTKLENSESGGLAQRFQKILDKKDVPSIMAAFIDVIKWSYGELSDDGREFRKSDEIYERFASTNAYDELFLELAHNSEAAMEFINGLLPKSVAAEIAKKSAEPASAPVLAPVQ